MVLIIIIELFIPVEHVILLFLMKSFHIDRPYPRTRIIYVYYVALCAIYDVQTHLINLS